RIRARYFAQPLDRIRQRELCAGKSAHEVTPTNLTAKFQSLELVVDRAPRHGRALAPPPVARHDSVPLQPLARDHSRTVIRIERAAKYAGLVHQRPASCPRGDSAGTTGAIGARPF